MVIDITSDINDYDIRFKKIYSKKYLELRGQFTNWISKNSTKNDLDWWVSIPASRNFNLSDLYHNFCLVESVKEASKKKFISELILSDVELKEIITNQLKVRFKITLRKKNFSSKFKNFYQLVKHYTFFLFIYFLTNFLKTNKLDNKKKYILIDTFLEQNDLKKNRFYGEKLLKKINKDKNILFIPCLYMGMGIISVIRKIFILRKNKNYVFKERHLNFKDIVKSFLCIFRIKNLKKKFSNLHGVDYTFIINKELYSYKNLTGQILGWQNYLFFKNIKFSKIRLKKTINWFENQSPDRGWNLGVRKFFPQAQSFGYQGFTYFPQYMCLSPSMGESSSKVVPQTILSIGKRFNSTKKEFCKNINVKVAPALNFQYLYNRKNKIDKKREINNSILVILSGFLRDDLNLMRWIINSKLHKYNFRVSIKEHPILKIEKIYDKLGSLPKNFFVTKNSFSDAVQNNKILICSGATSALTEIVIQGKFCIIPRINPFDGITLKKLGVSKNYKMIENSEELISFLKNFGNKKTKKYKLNEFFTKLSDKNIKIFL